MESFYLASSNDVVLLENDVSEDAIANAVNSNGILLKNVLARLNLLERENRDLRKELHKL